MLLVFHSQLRLSLDEIPSSLLVNCLPLVCVVSAQNIVSSEAAPVVGKRSCPRATGTWPGAAGADGLPLRRQRGCG